MACASKEENLDIALVRGEKIRFIVDYSLYDHNINGMIGLVIREDSGNGKPLVYVKLAGGEWIEPSQDMFIRLEPGVVPTDSLKFLSRVKRLGEV
tara:strand:- start:550 stop:834 length:285 start_codon:yes stop_codon:yes gene_type:complete